MESCVKVEHKMLRVVMEANFFLFTRDVFKVPSTW